MLDFQELIFKSKLALRVRLHRNCTTFSANHIYLCTTYALLGKKDEMRASREAFFSIQGRDRPIIVEPSWTDEALAVAHEHPQQIAGIK